MMLLGYLNFTSRYLFVSRLMVVAALERSLLAALVSISTNVPPMAVDVGSLQPLLES